MKTFIQRIEAIGAAIKKERDCMDAILKANCVGIPEDIYDEDERQLWENAHKSARYLEQQLERINSILHTCERYVFINCS